MPSPRHRWFAAIYDFFMRLEAGRMDELRRFAAGEASGRVLEIGCGTGLNLGFYDWSRLESIDLAEPDPFMLKRARDKAAELPGDVRDRVRLHEAPAEALPFADAAFDTVVSTLVLCTVADTRGALAEVRRVLRPGGTLRLVEHVRGTGKVATFQRLIQPVWGWTAAGCHLDRATADAIRAAWFDLDVAESFKLGPMLPAFRGVATRPQ